MELTRGYLDALWTGTVSSSDVQPVLQVESIKRVGKACERCRMMLSDGERLCPGALATQLQSLVNDEHLIPGSIVRLVETMVNNIENRKLLIILSIEVLERDYEKIGNPQPVSSTPMHQIPSSTATRSIGSNVPLAVSYGNGTMQVKNEASGFVPISFLNPYMSKWTIKARVTAKSGIRTYTNARGDGKVFSFDLLDSGNGEIRASCFNRDVETFFDAINVGSTYTISKCQLKPVQRPQYNHLRNANELFLESGTTIEPCPDDGNIEMQHFDFRSIAEIRSAEANTMVDIIGVVSSCTRTSTLLRKNGTETQKRVCSLRDQSGCQIELTMWGALCFEEGQHVQDLCDKNESPVVALKAGRISDFGGKSVGTISSSQLLINPERPEAPALREWYEREGRDAKPQCLSKEGGGSGVKSQVRKTISEMKDDGLGRGPTADYITVKAAIAFAKSENFYYKSCPNITGEGKICQKKVTEGANGGYFCEKCNLSSQTCDYRYLLQVQLQDDSGSSWHTAFQEAAEAILGVTAVDLDRWKSEGDPRATLVFNSQLFQQRLFKVRVKEEMWNDESRVKSTILYSELIDYAEESKNLLASIHRLAKGEPWAGPVPAPLQGSANAQPGYGNATSACYPGSEATAGKSMFVNNAERGNGYTNHNIYGSAAYQNGSASGDQAAPKGSGECYHCHQPGHWARDCPNKGMGKGGTVGMGGSANDWGHEQKYASNAPVQSYGGGAPSYGGGTQGYGQNVGGYGQNAGGYGQNAGGYGQNEGGYGQTSGGYSGGGGNGGGARVGYGGNAGAAGGTGGYGTSGVYGNQPSAGYGGCGGSMYNAGDGGHNGGAFGNGYGGNGARVHGRTGCVTGGGFRML